MTQHPELLCGCSLREFHSLCWAPDARRVLASQVLFGISCSKHFPSTAAFSLTAAPRLWEG